MSKMITIINSPEEIHGLVEKLRRTMTIEIKPDDVLNIFEHWAQNLGVHELNDIPGVAFLRLWLRRGTLVPIIIRELGENALNGNWIHDGHARIKAFPLGVVGHWPAGNIEIQPVLSMTCALLGGNVCIVRVPRNLYDITQRLMEKLKQCDPAGLLLQRIVMVSFDHSRKDVHEAIARSVDGAMIWGGSEAVLTVRSLSFPSWARLATFGPRISVAAMDSNTWCNIDKRMVWVERIARDVWQFDQQACTSPQVLFLEKKPGHDPSEFLQALSLAFKSENKLHPRQAIHSALTSAICLARSSWLLDDTARSAFFPQTPDWTILFGKGSDIPNPVQGKTLTVLEVKDLFEAIDKFDGNVQTLGLAISNVELEKEIAQMAAKRGVDRIVKLGRMHVFTSPWDGMDLIRPMVRIVRHVPSTE